MGSMLAGEAVATEAPAALSAVETLLNAGGESMESKVAGSMANSRNVFKGVANAEGLTTAQAAHQGSLAEEHGLLGLGGSIQPPMRDPDTSGLTRVLKQQGQQLLHGGVAGAGMMAPQMGIQYLMEKRNQMPQNAGMQQMMTDPSQTGLGGTVDSMRENFAANNMPDPNFMKKQMYTIKDPLQAYRNAQMYANDLITGQATTDDVNKHSAMSIAGLI